MTVDKKGFCVGAVVIGRNEGQRLINCIESLKFNIHHIVYVDSGSTDNSVQEAKTRNIDCVSLDLNKPFTAARARNEGAKYLVDNYSDIVFIQFIDGDCEVQSDWITKAYTFLVDNEAYAIVCGRRRERFSEKSIYNQLCDIEWDTPIGDALACGGDALIRAEALRQVDGYNELLIAGEEPEMCFRLRQHAWKIRRIDVEMTLHDADMARVGQWWSRAKRAGYAYASSYDLHGKTAEKFKHREVLSILTWALLVPILILMFSIYNVLYVSMIMVYPIQIIRLAIKHHDKCLGMKVSLSYAISTVMAKWPQLFGMLKFRLDKISGNNGRLIEYK